MNQVQLQRVLEMDTVWMLDVHLVDHVAVMLFGQMVKVAPIFLVA